MEFAPIFLELTDTVDGLWVIAWVEEHVLDDSLDELLDDELDEELESLLDVDFVDDTDLSSS